MQILAKVYNVRVNGMDMLVNTLLMTRFIKKLNSIHNVNLKCVDKVIKNKTLSKNK
mgnify:CR=1 FL=1